MKEKRGEGRIYPGKCLKHIAGIVATIRQGAQRHMADITDNTPTQSVLLVEATLWPGLLEQVV